MIMYENIYNKKYKIIIQNSHSIICLQSRELRLIMQIFYQYLEESQLKYLAK